MDFPTVLPANQQQPSATAMMMMMMSGQHIASVARPKIVWDASSSSSQRILHGAPSLHALTNFACCVVLDGQNVPHPIRLDLASCKPLDAPPSAAVASNAVARNNARLPKTRRRESVARAKTCKTSTHQRSKHCKERRCQKEVSHTQDPRRTDTSRHTCKTILARCACVGLESFAAHVVQVSGCHSNQSTSRPLATAINFLHHVVQHRTAPRCCTVRCSVVSTSRLNWHCRTHRTAPAAASQTTTRHTPCSAACKARLLLW